MTIFLFGSNTMPDNIKPAMSVDGWISAGSPKLDSLIDDFYCSEYSQTYLYRGEVCSLQWMVQQHIHDPYGLCNLLNERLKRYLERYFESASVEELVRPVQRAGEAIADLVAGGRAGLVVDVEAVLRTEAGAGAGVAAGLVKSASIALSGSTA
jgi:hypothetical protein